MSKIGFVFSGAGARIPQLCVLSKNLITGNYCINPEDPSKKGEPVIPNVLAGASSGALNAAVVNIIISDRNKPVSEQRYNWDKYEDDLKLIKNSPYTEGHQEYRTAYTWLPGDVKKGYVLQTHSKLYPKDLLYHTIKSIFDGMGVTYFGDLDPEIPVHVSSVNRETGETIRFYSGNPEHAKLPIVDVLMASTAIPVVFPERSVDGFGSFIDGGTGQDSVPVESMMNENCDQLWLVCRQGVKTYNHDSEILLLESLAPVEVQKQANPEGNHILESHQLKKDGNYFSAILDNALFAIDKVFADITYFQFDKAKEIAKEVYTYIPVLDTNYSMIDFNKGDEQLVATEEWSASNPPILLN